MNKENFRIIIGVSMISVHATCFLIIFYWKDQYLSESQQTSIALLFMPITAAYVVAVIRRAVDTSSSLGVIEKVSLNYAVVVSLFTFLSLGGLFWTVLSLQGAQEEDRQVILLYEIAFGAGFGVIATDLFGKIEVLRVESPDDKITPKK